MAMMVELADVAAGLPMAASLALAGGITSLREGRRRTALNEAMHELRRPLQVLSLCLPTDAPEAMPVESSLQLATVALERLDREINGAALEEVETEVPIADLVEEAERRWHPAALCSGVSLQVDRNGEDLWVGGNRFDLSQALDNLLSNAIEHGGGRVRIGWRREGSWVRVSVADTGASAGAKAGRRQLLRRRQCRRGHGLRVVGRVARRHGGSFTLSCAPHGAQASLRLPLRRRVDAG
jgi:signal transduction histidine kinase